MKKHLIGTVLLTFAIVACNTPTPVQTFNPSSNSNLDLNQGSSATLTINFNRDAGLTVPLTASVLGLPSGVSAASVTSSDASAVLNLSATATTALSSATDFSVQITDGTNTKTLSARQLRVLPALPNTLVSSFALGGVLLNPSLSAYRGVAVQTDDKVLVLSQNKLFRYSNTGLLDSSFGTAGIADLPVGFQGYRLLLQVDGKSLIVGVQSSAVKLERFNSDGTRDLSFTSGMASFGVGISNITAARFSDDKTQIYVGANLSNTDVGLVRFLAGGALDTAFDTDGMQSLNLGGNDTVSGLLVRPNAMYMVGESVSSSNRDAAIAKLSLAGALDTGFNSTGIRKFDFMDTNGAFAQSSAAQIFAAGQSVRVVGGANTLASDTLLSHVTSAQFTALGAADITFSSDGFEASALGFEASIDRVFRDSSDRYLAVGAFATSGVGTFYAARLSSAGLLDTTYGTNGLGRVSTISGSPSLEAGREDNQGNIVLVGGVNTTGIIFKFVP
jgi:uncharacterized delta-60 repeat protein